MSSIGGTPAVTEPLGDETKPPEKITVEQELRQIQKLSKDWEKTSAKNQCEQEYSGSILKHIGNTDRLNPIYVVLVDEDLIPNHNKIYEDAFLNFLREFISSSVLLQGSINSQSEVTGTLTVTHPEENIKAGTE